MRTEEYSADTVWKMIQNKRMLIDYRDHGSYCAADMLIDCELHEKRYLSKEQREIIAYVFEKQYSVQQTANILDKPCVYVKNQVYAIKKTLEDRMR